MYHDGKRRADMRTRVGRRDFLRGIGGTTVVGLAGCLGGESVGREIKLGLLMGTTGGFEDLGPPIRAATRLVADQVNDADTDFSVDARFEDTESEPDRGVDVAETLVDAGFPMLCGALNGSVTGRVATEVAVPDGVAMCSPASTSSALAELEDDDLVFRTPRTNALQGRTLARVAAERLDHDTAATLYRDDPYGSEISRGFVEALEGTHGGATTDAVSYTAGESSYATPVERALQGDPGVLLVAGYPTSGVQLLEDLYAAVDPGDLDVLVSNGLQSSGLPARVGHDMTNVGGTAPVVEGSGLETFQSLFADAAGAGATGQAYVRQGYDAAAALVLANAAAGENDGTAVSEQLRPVTDDGGETVTVENLVDGLEMAARGESINYQGVSGPVAFDERGDLAKANYEYFEFTGDGLAVVDRVAV